MTEFNGNNLVSWLITSGQAIYAGLQSFYKTLFLPISEVLSGSYLGYQDNGAYIGGGGRGSGGGNTGNAFIDFFKNAWDNLVGLFNSTMNKVQNTAANVLDLFGLDQWSLIELLLPMGFTSALLGIAIYKYIKELAL